MMTANNIDNTFFIPNLLSFIIFILTAGAENISFNLALY